MHVVVAQDTLSRIHIIDYKSVLWQYGRKMTVDLEKAYLEEMVVIFLTDEELKFELEIRNLIDHRDHSITVLRRKMRCVKK